MKRPKWLTTERVALVCLVIGAGMNINVVVHDHSLWLNAGLAGMSIAWLMALGAISIQSRIIAKQREMLEELSSQLQGLLEMKSQEIGAMLWARFHGEPEPPHTTKH